MYSHPHMSPVGYTRRPSKSCRAFRAAAGFLGVASLAVVVVVPWWVGIATMLGAWR